MTKTIVARPLRKRPSLKTLKGTVMIEIILGVIFMGAVLVAVLLLTRSNDVKADARSEGQSLGEFRQAASNFFRANRSVIETAMADGTGADQWCRIGVAADGTGGTQTSSITKHTCAFDASLMAAKGLWPNGLATGTRDSRFVVIFRQIYHSTTPTMATGDVDALFVLSPLNGALEPSVVTSDTVDQLTAAKSAGGGAGGYVPLGRMGACTVQASSTTYEACGNGWKVNLSDFLDSAQISAMADSLPN
jgi:hypothetical protein